MSGISEIQSFKDLKKAKNELEFLLKYNVTFKTNDEIIKTIAAIEELLLIPEKYNTIFQSSGWIAHNSIEYALMRDAIYMYEKENLEKAQNLIIERYEHVLKYQNNFYIQNKYAYTRKRLIELCIDDYFNRRYYSCIPVMLMIIDGIVSDANQNSGAYSTKDYSVWDSLIGHPSTLQKIMCDFIKVSRKKTNNSRIEFPYRNGILHGRELKYDNKIVAIKTFVVFFYIIDWLVDLDTEEQRKESYEKKELELDLKKLQEHQQKMLETNKLLEKWIPRESETLYPEDFNRVEENSPEFATKKFIDYLIGKNFGSPYEFFPKQIVGELPNERNNFIRDLKNGFEDIEIKAINQISFEDKSPATSEVLLVIEYDLDRTSHTKEIKFNMSYTVNNQIENRLIENGKWTIVNIKGIWFDFL